MIMSDDLAFMIVTAGLAVFGYILWTWRFSPEKEKENEIPTAKGVTV
jgi:hypothetical protein